MYSDIELNIIKCLKNRESPNWMKLLKDKDSNLFHLMGNGGQGSSIIVNLNPKLLNVINDLISSNKLIVIDENYHSFDYNKNFILYEFV